MDWSIIISSDDWANKFLAKIDELNTIYSELKSIEKFYDDKLLLIYNLFNEFN
jgi:hypothetical protein